MDWNLITNAGIGCLIGVSGTVAAWIITNRLSRKVHLDARFRTVVPLDFGIDFCVELTNYSNHKVLVEAVALQLIHSDFPKGVNFDTSERVTCYDREMSFEFAEIPAGDTRSMKAQFRTEDLAGIRNSDTNQLNHQLVKDLWYESSGGLFHIVFRSFGRIKHTKGFKFEVEPITVTTGRQLELVKKMLKIRSESSG